MRNAVLRHRLLVVMGLPSILACSKDTTGTTATPPGTTASPSATATPSVTATPSATASAPTNLGPASGHGGCGTVQVCNPAPAKAATPAAPPFQACEQTIASNTAGSNPHHEGSFDATLTTEKRKSTPGVCCYVAPRAFCGGGRPLRGEAGLILAPVVPSWDWLDRPLALSPADPDDDLAARFELDARSEHASIASFARTSLQLLAVGAPPELVGATHAAAEDEIAHARACFALAHRRGADANGPGPLAIDRAPFACTFPALVRDTFVDGCVAETRAALEIRERDGDDVERATLTAIADDEDRHVELAWRTLAWAVRQGGAPARAALAEELAALATGDSLIEDVIRPCAEALLAHPSATHVTLREARVPHA